ncbi:hypothetical protein ACFQV2_33695 [Actinokineospora soli]|uniref:Fibronectin attachment protein n=1 Tax=Actinokineospora soli TaxID=1048753 RepID=A0ABW2TVY3_9PSEU
MVKDPAERMTLQEVRELLHPAPGAGGVGLRGPAHVGGGRRDRGDPPRARPGDRAGAARGDQRAAGPAPGPLPFTPSVRTRGAVAAAVLTLAAAVLFAAGAAGGFALARVVGGEPVLPRTTTSAPPAPEAPVTELVVRSADASTLAGEQGGGFSVPVPEDWVKFVEQRTPETLPNSTRVHWVAPTGTAELVVERFPGFRAKHAVEDYVAYVENRAPDYRLVGSTPLAGTGLRLTYRTVESFRDAPGGPAPDLARVTFADVLPTGDDLWVVSLTVPIEQEDSARSGLFAQITQGFAVSA